MFHILLVINLEITTLLLDLSRLLVIWSFTSFPEKKKFTVVLLYHFQLLPSQFTFVSNSLGYISRN